MPSRTSSGVSPEALSPLLEHDYPGNVRELDNIIQHAFVLCQGSVIRTQHLLAYLQGLTEHGVLSLAALTLKSESVSSSKTPCDVIRGAAPRPPGNWGSLRALCSARRGLWVSNCLKPMDAARGKVDADYRLIQSGDLTCPLGRSIPSM